MPSLLLCPHRRMAPWLPRVAQPCRRHATTPHADGLTTHRLFAPLAAGEDIVPFLQPLLERLTSLLQNSTRETQEMAISALASVAMAAGTKFQPYFQTVYGLMRMLLTVTSEAELPLRARAMECIGLMNLAVGREVCEPIIQEVTMAALAGLQLDLPELREYTCAPLLPRALPGLRLRAHRPRLRCCRECLAWRQRRRG